MPTFADFIARLTPFGPNYQEWRTIFDQDEIPLTSPLPLNAKTPDGRPTMVYEIDWRKMTLREFGRLCEVVMRGLQTDDISRATKYLRIRGGYPIQKEDVVVTMKPQLRAFEDPK